MIKKKENCEYCGEKMESKTAKKKFCSDKCRVYSNRVFKVADKIIAEMDIIAQNKIKIENAIKSAPNYSESLKSPKNDKKMPSGLSGTEQIQWRIDNL